MFDFSLPLAFDDIPGTVFDRYETIEPSWKLSFRFKFTTSDNQLFSIETSSGDICKFRLNNGNFVFESTAANYREIWRDSEKDTTYFVEINQQYSDTGENGGIGAYRSIIKVDGETLWEITSYLTVPHGNDGYLVSPIDTERSQEVSDFNFEIIPTGKYFSECCKKNFSNP